MFRLVTIIGSIILVLTILVTISTNDQAFKFLVTPTLAAPQSIFDEDTCTPPCWFGLTPDESTAGDVEALFAAQPDLFTGENSFLYEPMAYGEIDPQTGYLRDGRYRFNFVGWERPDDPVGGYSQIGIEDGYVNIIGLHVVEYIPVEDVLSVLGVPDRIHLWWFGAIGHEKMVLDFMYLNLNLRIAFRSITNQCDLLNIEQDFWVSMAVYYSSETAIMPVRRPFIDVDQPALVAYASIYARDVSLETFDAWLEGEQDLTCVEAWAALPEEVILPTMAPTLTPVPTVSR